MSTDDFGKPFDVMKTLNTQMESIQRGERRRANPGEWAYERLVRSINEFEQSLDPTEEIGARLVNFVAGEVVPVFRTVWRLS